MSKISLVFFATPDIAINSFLSLACDSEFEIKALVTQAPKPSCRGKKICDSNIKKEALKLGIKVIEPEKLSKDEEAIKTLEDIKPDFFVTFAYGQILSERVLNIPKFETINLHASLLPKYRGANPICECLLNGEEKTGITTMITVSELDAGDICLTKEIPLDKEIDFEKLSEKISSLSPNIIKETLKGLYKGKICPIKQNNRMATYTKKTEKKDKLLDFACCSDVIHNKIRAYCGINTTHFVYNKKIIKVYKSSAINKISQKEPGEVISVDKDGILISCKTGAILIETVKPEGKNLMSAYDWSLGSKIKKGDKISCN